jgi:hypothetical protein
MGVKRQYKGVNRLFLTFNSPVKGGLLVANSAPVRPRLEQHMDGIGMTTVRRDTQWSQAEMIGLGGGRKKRTKRKEGGRMKDEG